MLVRLVSNSQPYDPPASAPQSDGITGLSHLAWHTLDIIFLGYISKNRTIGAHRITISEAFEACFQLVLESFTYLYYIQ